MNVGTCSMFKCEFCDFELGERCGLLNWLRQPAEGRMIMATEFNTQVGNGKHCLRFETDNREYYLLMQETARRCVDGKPTNADRIRQMSDEELAL